MDTLAWNLYLLAISVFLQQCLRGYCQTITCPTPCTNGYTCAMVRHGNAPPSPGCIDSTEALMLQQAMGGGPSGPGAPVDRGVPGIGHRAGSVGIGLRAGEVPGLGLGFPPSRGFPSPPRETMPSIGALGLQGGLAAGPGFQDRFGQGIRGQSPEAFSPMEGVPQGLPGALAPPGAFLDPLTGRTVGSMPPMPQNPAMGGTFGSMPSPVPQNPAMGGTFGSMPSPVPQNPAMGGTFGSMPPPMPQTPSMGTVAHSHGLIAHTHLPDGSVRAVSTAGNPRRRPGRLPPLQIPLGGGGGQTDPGGGAPGVINPPSSQVPDLETLVGSSTNTNTRTQSSSQGRATTIQVDQNGAYYRFYPRPTSLGIRVNFTKNGFCSRRDANSPDRAFCMNMCYSDSQCPDDMKCCPSGCSLGCVRPIAPRESPANIGPANLGTPTVAPSGIVPPRVDCSAECRFHTDCPAQDFCGLNEFCGQVRVCQRMSM